MKTTRSTDEFMLGQPDAFVIPAEALSPEGITGTFQDAMRGERGIADDWIDLFNSAFVSYWRRTADLAQKCPQSWLPPRLQNVLIAGTGEAVLPFSQPFYRASWTMFASDFDPAISNPEFAAYLFLHQERMAQTQQILAAFVQNLPYWLVRTGEEIDAFQTAAKQAARPDAAAFVALADALPMIRTLHDSVLKPPVLRTNEPLMQVPPTTLVATQSQIASLQEMGNRVGKSVERTMASFAGRFETSGDEGFETLLSWLDEHRPQVIVTAKPHEILWAPDGDADGDAFRDVAGEIAPEVAQSLIADLEVIGECTRRFLASLRQPEDLPPPHEDMEQQGLSYLHLDRNLIAYSLTDPAGNRLKTPSPSYDRLMLAARTIHEWGHQAVDAGWVPIAEEKEAEFHGLNRDLERLFGEIIEAAPQQIMAAARPDLGALSRGAGSAERALATYAQSRMPDYQANLLSQRYLTRPQAEAYVRNNVYCLIGVYKPAQIFRQLARYAYEYQYVRFSDMSNADSYFRSTTWFGRQFIESGVVSEAHVDALFKLMSSICDCYVVRDSAFDFGAIASPAS